MRYEKKIINSKRIDIGIQLCVFFIPLVIGFGKYHKNYFDYLNYFAISLLLLGPTQIFSMIFHRVDKNAVLFSKSRKIYEVITIILVTSILSGLKFLRGDDLLVFAMVITIVSPIGACFYFFICLRELRFMIRGNEIDGKKESE